MIVNIHNNDDITVKGNTTALALGDMVTITFTFAGQRSPLDHTVKTPDGSPKLFEVMEQDGKLGIMYPGRDMGGVWHDEQFTPFNEFAWTVDFEIVSRKSV